MNPLRTVGLLTVVFVLTLPFMYVLNHGLPALKLDSTTKEDDIPDEPDDPATDALLLKAVLYMQDGQNDKAIAAYTEAIKRSPKYSLAYIGRGDAYLAKSDYDRALLDYDEAARLDPRNEDIKKRAEVVREVRAGR
jgi:tetratricopeptide (TPR) repeat protein